MNRYQKEKSREIRDIMRTDRWGKMAYKEARRQWKKGVRAFRVGDIQSLHAWKAANLAHLGFSRSTLRDAGRAYHKLIKDSIAIGVTFCVEFLPRLDHYSVQFDCRDRITGNRFRYIREVSSDLLRNAKGDLVCLETYIIGDLTDELKRLGVKPAITDICASDRLIKIPDGDRVFFKVEDNTRLVNAVSHDLVRYERQM